MEKERQESKKHGESSASFKRKQIYSKEGLLPESILSLIPYKETYEALQNEDNEALQNLLSSFVRISMLSAFKKFDSIDQKRDKKNIMKAHVYLDALITLHRLPT